MDVKKTTTWFHVLILSCILTGSIFGVLGLYKVPVVMAKQEGQFLIPESFSSLAEIVSPTVVNIRTVKNR